MVTHFLKYKCQGLNCVFRQIYLSRHQSLLQLLQTRRQGHHPQFLLDLPAVCVCGGRGLAVALGDGGEMGSSWNSSPGHDLDWNSLSYTARTYELWVEHCFHLRFLGSLFCWEFAVCRHLVVIMMKQAIHVHGPKANDGLLSQIIVHMSLNYVWIKSSCTFLLLFVIKSVFLVIGIKCVGWPSAWNQFPTFVFTNEWDSVCCFWRYYK